MEFELTSARSKLVDFEHKEKLASSHSQTFMREINRLHDEVRELQVGWLVGKGMAYVTYALGRPRSPQHRGCQVQQQRSQANQKSDYVWCCGCGCACRWLLRTCARTHAGMHVHSRVHARHTRTGRAQRRTKHARNTHNFARTRTCARTCVRTYHKQARQGEYDALLDKAKLVDAKDAEIARKQLQLEEYLKELEWMRKEHANALLMHTNER